MSALGPSAVSEAAASLGLCAVVWAWLVGGPVDGPVGLLALGVLCVRLLAAAAADLRVVGEQRDVESALPLPPSKRLGRGGGGAGGGQRQPGPDAAAVPYRFMAGTPLPPGTRVPSPAPITVADKLDTRMSVFDFIPLKLQAGIRLNKRLGAGNVDVTQWFQAAINFVGQNAGPGQTPLSPLIVDVPAGRYYVGNLLIAHGIVLRGQAIQSTMLCAVPGTKGSWLQNPRTGPPGGHGNAGKISIEKIHFYGGKFS